MIIEKLNRKDGMVLHITAEDIRKMIRENIAAETEEEVEKIYSDSIADFVELEKRKDLLTGISLSIGEMFNMKEAWDITMAENALDE